MFRFSNHALGAPLSVVKMIARVGGTLAAMILMLIIGIDPAGAISSRRLITPTGGAAGDDFGYSVSSVGDVNGDGYPDLGVGARTAGSNAGAVYIYFGGPGLHSTPDVVLTGETSSEFGVPVAAAGDVNGDGYPDLIAGAFGYGGTTGRVYVFYGGPTFVSKGAASADVILTGEASSYFGYSVSTAGDVNGDGRADVIVGAPWFTSYTGRAYIFYGGATFVSKPAANANVILTGEATNDFFGMSVSTAGDLNGDGRADVIVGANGYNSNMGRAYVFYGGSTLLSKPAGSADVILTGESASGQFGFSVSGAGDVNGDGRAEVIVGAQAYSSFTGHAYVFYGGSTLFSKPAGSADVILTCEGAYSSFGRSVSLAGDVNGDGRPDLIVGAPFFASNTGRAYLFYGGPSLVSKGAASADLILNGEAVNTYFGLSVSGAGDLKQDGFSDVVVGAYGYSAFRGRAYLYDMNRYQLLSPIGGDT